jgi:hypothetical protein
LSAGVVLYAMLLAMVVRAGRTPVAKSRVDPLLLLTSVVGLLWNVCALLAYELPKVGVEGPFPILGAVGFGALGFLPAVVVHSVLRGTSEGVRGSVKPALVAIAYTLSTSAALLHFQAGWMDQAVPSAFGMRLLTYTFVALVIPLAGVTRGQPGSRRAIWATALAIFAVSALHLSQLHKGEAAWPVELVGHHASLPLAFAILYQDYPFALADLFLKRALALLAIVAVAFAGIATFGVRSEVFAQFVRADPRQVGVLVTLWVGTALLYPGLRRVIAWFVDSVVLRRPDYRALRGTITRQLQSQDDVTTVLDDVCLRLAPAMSARSVTWREWLTVTEEEALSVVVSGHEASALLKATDPSKSGSEPSPHSVAAVVIVPTTEPPRYALTISELTGGRRLLSDDLGTLETIAVLVARRIDAIRITNERYARELREREIGKLATEAELRALRAQMNPHFLFNALTTIGYLIQTAPPRALETLLRLTALLRGVLRSEGELTTLGRELDLVQAYLDIERARFEHRLLVTIDVPSHLRSIQLPPLVLQPLVENAVKHGIGHKQVGGEVTIRGRIERGLDEKRHLSVIVQDTGAGTTAALLQRGRDTGVGLRNVERRLECQYGPDAFLSIHTVPGRGTKVEIRVPIDLTASADKHAARVVM